MREFLREPLFWMRETVRRHWLEVLTASTIFVGAITVSHLLA